MTSSGDPMLADGWNGGVQPCLDAHEFDSAYRDHHVAILRMAAGLVGPGAAADVAQDVFLRLWRNPQRFDASRGSMRTFLFAMTRNVAIDHLRSETSRSARQNRVGREDGRAEAGRVAPDAAVAQDTATRVHLALAGLPVEMRESIVTAFYGGLTYRETADALGHQEGTVKSRIRKGLVRLRAELGDLTDPEAEPT